MTEDALNKDYFLGLDALSKGLFSETIRFLKAFLDNAPEYSEYYNPALYNIALGYGAVQDCNNVIKYLQPFLNIYTEKDQNYSNACFNLGFAYGRIGNYFKTIECLEKYFKSNPQKDEAYDMALLHIGDAFSHVKEYDKAIKSWGEISLEARDYNLALYNSGRISIMAEKILEARVFFQRYLDRTFKNNIDYNEDALSVHTTIVALINLGRFSEVKKSYFDWLEGCIDKGAVDYCTSMKIYEMGYILGDYDGSLVENIAEKIKTYINKLVTIENSRNRDKFNEYEADQLTFYQYCHHSQNIINNIKNDQIYFSDPLNFNDPFDPLIRVFDKERSEGLARVSNFRISCLAPQNDNLLLWSHYADKHQGMCIAYDIGELLSNKKIIFRKIKYEDIVLKPQEGLVFDFLNLPPLSLECGIQSFPSSEKSELNKKYTLLETFIRKHIVWKYEDEYRLILQADREEEFLQSCNIKEIYLGRDMPKEKIENIKKMIKEINMKKHKNIKLYSMQEGYNNLFKLDPELLELN